MSRFAVFAEREAFNDITFNGDYPNLKTIFSEHSKIYLNISPEDLAQELITESEIFFFLHAYAGAQPPESYQAQFENVYDDPANLISTPRSMYFLKVTKAQADQMQDAYGVIVQSVEGIDDTVLSASFFRELEKDEVMESGGLSGWKYLLNFDIPPSNAIVIYDNYLFKDTENIANNPVSVGKENIKWLLDKLLPPALNVEYHVTLISDNYDRLEQWRAQLAGNLNTEINNLRPYDINVEVVFMKPESLHKRRLIMNYVNASCDRGFCVFKVRDGKTVKGVNDVRFNRIFCTLQNHKGDTEYASATKALQIIKKETNGLAAHIVSGVDAYRGAILGGCNADKTLKNRIINDV